MLRDLLATWETWSARNSLTRALGNVADGTARDALTRGLADTPEVDPLDALRDAAELVALLQGWQWQTIYAARREGASWDDIATVTGVTAKQARADYAAALDRQERHGVGDASEYRQLL